MDKKEICTGFAFEEMDNNFHSQPTKLVMSDLNCYCSVWGYINTDANGEKLEHWAKRLNLKLIHDPKPSPKQPTLEYNVLDVQKKEQ